MQLKEYLKLKALWWTGIWVLKFRRWFRWLWTFFKVKTSGKPEYVLNLIPTDQHSYNTQSLDKIETYYCRIDTFKNSFFPYTIVEWNKLDLDIGKSKSYAIFRNALLKIGWPNQRSVYRIYNPMRLKLINRLRLGLSHLNEHRINHNFKSCINPLLVVALQLNQSHIFYCTAITSHLLNSRKQHKWSFRSYYWS